jgi:hypothetical protein
LKYARQMTFISLERRDIGAIDLHAHGVVRRHSSRLQDSPNVVQRLLHFGFEVVGNLACSILAANTFALRNCYSVSAVTAFARRSCSSFFF